MPSEKIYAATADPTWEIEENDGHINRPGVVVQFQEHDQLAVASGDLARDGGNPELPAVNVLDFLPLPTGWDANAQSEQPYADLTAAITAAINTAWETGCQTPRYVWLARRDANDLIKALRRGRGYAFGTDE